MGAAASLFNEQFAQLPAGRQSSAGGENGYAVFEVEKGRITLQDVSGFSRITGEPMAFDEHFIDFVNCFPAVAGRMARPERRLELRALRVLPPHPPAGETPGLARQIFERQLEGLEPAG